MSLGFDPNNVNLTEIDPTAIICYLNSGGNDYDGRIGARISALFVILIVSSAVTCFPLAASRIKSLRIPVYIYLFARYFGAGVIIATAFIHLLDPAYSEIGPNSCVGMTGGWATYSWCPAIVLASIMVIFLLDFTAERYVEEKYGRCYEHASVEHAITESAAPNCVPSAVRLSSEIRSSHQMASIGNTSSKIDGKNLDLEESTSESDDDTSTLVDISFKQQITAFLILEFGVIFHSVIIGLNLGSVGAEFSVLYPVLVFHQSFEGLGIGSRMSAIPFPKHLSWLPWTLCALYGLTTPIAIAIGLEIRTTYNASSFTANVVSGVLDAISAGILIYTGLVELLARDFLFDPNRSRDSKRLAFMIVCVLAGAGIMALLGKWA